MTARMRHLRRRHLDGLKRRRLDHTKSALARGVPAGRAREYTFTADNTTERLTITGQDNLAVGNPRVILEGTLPAGLTTGTLYWLRDAGVNLYTLHPTKSSAAAGTSIVAFTTNGTGTLTLTILE